MSEEKREWMSEARDEWVHRLQCVQGQPSVVCAMAMLTGAPHALVEETELGVCRGTHRPETTV